MASYLERMLLGSTNSGLLKSQRLIFPQRL